MSVPVPKIVFCAALLSICLTGGPARSQDGARDALEFASPRFFYALLDDGAVVETAAWAEIRDTLDAPNEYRIPTSPLAGAGQPPLPDAERERITASIDTQLLAIDEERTQNGVRSPALVAKLTRLAELYGEVGDHLFAVAALNDALQIERINHGLHSIGQVDVVERMIENQAAMGEFEEAEYWQSYMLELTWRSPGDPRVPGILTAIADQQLDRAAFELERGTQPVFSITTGFSISRPAGAEIPWIRPSAARGLVLQARRNYRGALQSAIASGEYEVPELLELESRLVDTFYYELTQSRLGGSTRRSPGSPFGGARRVLEAKISNARSFKDPLAVVLAMMELGDWNLMYSLNGHALDDYRDAYDYALAHGVPDATLAAVFSPAAPVPLPAFGPFDMRYDPERDYDGYIDVAIGTSRYGESKDVDILETSAHDSKPIERRLRRQIAQTNYRPRFVDGELARSDRFTLRYYYVY